MIQGGISRRYAKALFQLALEERREEEIAQELERFAAAYAGSPLGKVLGNPTLGMERRKNILSQVAQALGLSPVSAHFASLLLERDRLASLSSIAARYRRLLDEAKGQVKARVVTPTPAEAELLERLRAVLKRISGKEVVLEAESDPGLIGGVVIELEGKIYDGSVRAQLEKMTERIERGY